MNRRQFLMLAAVAPLAAVLPVPEPVKMKTVTKMWVFDELPFEEAVESPEEMWNRVIRQRFEKLVQLEDEKYFLHGSGSSNGFG